MTTKPLFISSSSYNIKIYNARSAWNVGFIYATTEDSFNLIILMEMHFLTTGPFILLWACCWRMKIIFIFQNIVNTTTSDLSFSRLKQHNLIVFLGTYRIGSTLQDPNEYIFKGWKILMWQWCLNSFQKFKIPISIFWLKTHAVN